MAIIKEKTIARKTIYKGKIMDLHSDSVMLDGSQKKREVISVHAAAAILPVTSEGNFILVRQYRYPVKQVLLEIPAGKQEDGESLVDTAARELHEETGYIGDLTYLGDIYTTPGFSDEKIALYIGTNLKKGEQHLDDGEYLDIEIVTPEKFIGLIQCGQIKDAKTLSIFALLPKNFFQNR